ncbi:protein/domain typically associated with flavoprotein oxygenase, DIM6/NTAB family protein [Hahella sp. CCB-MM4]|uniref:flavin reductase family protein n=1 Tax=Hahella sp. (strain CCB-MM4) TaxID=1926491 RepID=UPI000B9A6540|nr:flavin reductase family protein [Hahella sp. CCB-MM4]OZG73827.1 protein/domain typically associated with flavoprotein oxygenase, DIM6/NTAB family protein [Hahella sp. CCB-MM4]
MNIDLAQLQASEIYHLMTQTVIPRPIAWILSENSHVKGTAEGQYNLAPFSFFNALTSAPPTLVVSIGKKPDGELKDTRSNLVTGKPCVVHIADATQVQMVSDSSRTLEYGKSELDSLALNLVEFEQFELPRIKECHIAFGCRVSEVVELGPVPQALILLQIEKLYLGDEVTLTDAKGRLKVDAKKVNPLARLGANEYASIGEVITLDRPK